MGRAPRIEYSGALYHVMSRGNRQEDIFLDDQDHRLFLDTLDEACGRTGWIVHSYVLMRNHYHLLLETPEPNLVDGMRWLQGTYTKRFNGRHKQWGHLLQGRYKALPISPDGDYFRTVGDYIHLNPARAHCVELKTGPLESYPWNSYPLYLEPASRPNWLGVDRLLGALGFADNDTGRARFEEATRFKVEQIKRSPDPKEFDTTWKQIRRDWACGDEAFKAELQQAIGSQTGSHSRMSYSGDAIKRHDEHEARQMMNSALQLLGLNPEELPRLRRSDPRKKAVAWLIRSSTSVRNQWISENLHMGTPSNLSHFHREVAEATDGALFTLKSKLLNNRTDTHGGNSG